MMRDVDVALQRCGIARTDIHTRQRLICFLLGSPPADLRVRLQIDGTTYRDVLRATARFIHSVYATRWHTQQ